MAGWPRIIRGMVRTGLTFAVGVGAVTSIVGSIITLVTHSSFRELFQMVGKFWVVGFLLGVVFSGFLAAAARSRWLARLSIPRVASLGAAAGLLYFALIGVNARGHWSAADASLNLVTLLVLGGGSAAAVLVLARRGSAELRPGEGARLVRDE